MGLLGIQPNKNAHQGNSIIPLPVMAALKKGRINKKERISMGDFSLIGKVNDAEQEQALIRCTLVFIVTAYLWGFPFQNPLTFASPQLVSLNYLALSLPVYLWIRKSPGRYAFRKAVFTIMDQLAIAYCVSFDGLTAPIIALSFWVLIGSAFRFGLTYLYLSSTVAISGMFYNIYFSPAWQGSGNFGWGLILSILFVSIYTAFLVSRTYEANTKLRQLLRHDSLTGLPNRLSLTERITHSIARTKRLNTCMSLLYFDLDGFKDINDTFGHSLGDQLLKEVARRIKSRIREPDMLARLGGDEFIVVLEDVHYPQDAIEVAKTLLDILNEIHVEGTIIDSIEKQCLHVSASIGISAYRPALAITPPSVDELIKQADDAMYDAKKSAKGCYRLWEDIHQ